MSQINFSNGGVLRMTTTKSSDFLNRLTSISSVPSSGSPISYSYTYNNANQRVRTTLADGSWWQYEYDALGQVVSGHKFFPDQTPFAGQQFDYSFDNIGNRTQTLAGGDQNGLNQRAATYGANNLNQYTNRTVPGSFDVIGLAFATNTVTVAGQAAYQKAEYFRSQVSVANGSAAIWTNIVVSEGGQSSVTGSLYLAQSPERYVYDADGNLMSDGRWTNTWDAENRLVSMQGLSGIPTGAKLKVDLVYDYQGRRIQKLVSTNNGSGYFSQTTNRFLYDGWNLVAVVNLASSVMQSFVWGSDLSGRQQGAGGIGGLLEVNDSVNGIGFVAYDGNGDTCGVIKGADGTVSAQYEYGPFGEVVRLTGSMAKGNPIGFSSKYRDDEGDLLYYGYRYYNPSTARWLSRDPLGDGAFKFLAPRSIGPSGGTDAHMQAMVAPYIFNSNDPIAMFDPLGLWPSASPWYGWIVNLGTPMPLTHENANNREIPGTTSDIAILNAATVYVDSGQGTELSYQHAMSAPEEPEAVSRARANYWVRSNLRSAQRNLCSCHAMDHVAAMWQFGLALHTVQDSTSPAHHGFQTWHGLSLQYWPSAVWHVAQESFDPGPGSNLDQATAWLWGFMRCPAPALPYDFFIFDEDEDEIF